ncbi:MAG: hypothetical protein M1823_001916 [Watsoniomyces obsoletus]|nr:MAG: hypothetical protein M1823_001916 [Watsoniomyces obsoletus]
MKALLRDWLDEFEDKLKLREDSTEAKEDEMRQFTLKANGEMDRLLCPDQTDLGVMKNRVKHLRLMIDHPLEARNVCFDVFKLQRYPDIWAGFTPGFPAREGDPVMDARMYERGIRTDGELFKEVYHLAWKEVLHYREWRCNRQGRCKFFYEQCIGDHAPTIEALAAYGTLELSLSEVVFEIPEGVEAAFHTFIQELHRGGLRKDYLDDPDSAEAMAYEKFKAEYSAVYGSFELGIASSGKKTRE